METSEGVGTADGLGGCGGVPAPRNRKIAISCVVLHWGPAQVGNQPRPAGPMCLDEHRPDELRPAGELRTCRVRNDLHNGKFAWDLDLWHSFCWIVDKGHHNGGYWALANLTFGVSTFVCLDTPRDPNGQRDPYPPLGEWIRGRPGNGSKTFPRGQTHFTLSLKPRIHAVTEPPPRCIPAGCFQYECAH